MQLASKNAVHFPGRESASYESAPVGPGKVINPWVTSTASGP
jgi:hypothetical protein